jgi:hypothetical protein
MEYITVRQSPMYHQMTVEELLFSEYTPQSLITSNAGNTRTYAFDRASERFTKCVDAFELISKLRAYNVSTESLHDRPRQELYTTFSIPKRSGGFRRIDAPNSDLMLALRRQKIMYEQDFHALYHTSAFAYVKGRSTIDAVKRHQRNESKWFLKLDLHNFFGSTTLDFIMSMFSQVFPFSQVVRYPQGRGELACALELATLNGGLPQGTPISPLITNIMMIPIDYTLTKALRRFNRQQFVYTRYADDFIISSKYNFDYHEVEQLVVDTLASFNAPFTINATKTRYGSANGSNWNLGVMLNQDNQITIGYKRKRQFETMLTSYLNSRGGEEPWPRGEIMTLQGLYSYYRMVEPKTIDAIVKHVGDKKGVNIIAAIRQDLR